jgi:competence protein ComEC
MGAKTAVVSVGRHNAYGHPAPGVVEAYQAAGMSLLRTDRDGAVWITARLSRPELLIATAQDAALKPVPWSSRLAAEERNNWGRLFR